MKIQKVIALLLAVLLLIMLTACGGEKEESSPEPEASAPAQAESGTQAASGTEKADSGETNKADEKENSEAGDKDTGKADRVSYEIPAEPEQVDYCSVTAPEVEFRSAARAEDSRQTISGAFKIESDSGSGYSMNGSVLTITGEGDYTLTGALNGHLVVDAGEGKVTLNLSGCSISCDTAAPITVLSADKVIISAKKETFNEIQDLRSARTEDTEEELTPEKAGAAIYSSCDLTIKGQGALLVSAGYNNGIASKDDLEIKNLTLQVTAANNALKGNDSVTLDSAEVIAVAAGGDGIKTENSCLSGKGKQKGTITISGGTVNVYAAKDGLSAAYDAVLTGDGYLSVFTDSYSDYSAGSSRDDSTKGIKAGNSVLIEGSVTVLVRSTDDAVHVNGGDALENGGTGAGDFIMNGGTVQLTTGDDGVHADSSLTIHRGILIVTDSYEGLEAAEIIIRGGRSYIYASDDGVNGATSDRSQASVIVEGGYLEVETPSGDTDAIDVNGSYSQSGGFVLVKGGSTMGSMAGSVDVDGSVTVDGGCIIACGGVCEGPSGAANAYISSGTGLSQGDYLLQDEEGNTVASFALNKSFSGIWLACDGLETGKAYTLTTGGSPVLSWTQEAGTMGTAYGGFGGGGFGGGPGGGGGFGGSFGGGPGGGGGGRGPGR